MASTPVTTIYKVPLSDARKDLTDPLTESTDFRRFGESKTTTKEEDEIPRKFLGTLPGHNEFYQIESAQDRNTVIIGTAGTLELL